MLIRTYNKNDKQKVVELLRLNTPAFFDPKEEMLFSNYLDKKVEDYFVVLIGNEIIGAGGVNYFYEERSARISWGVIKPEFQRKGIGTQII